MEQRLVAPSPARSRARGDTRKHRRDRAFTLSSQGGAAVPPQRGLSRDLSVLGATRFPRYASAFLSTDSRYSVLAGNSMGSAERIGGHRHERCSATGSIAESFSKVSRRI